MMAIEEAQKGHNKDKNTIFDGDDDLIFSSLHLPLGSCASPIPAPSLKRPLPIIFENTQTNKEEENGSLDENSPLSLSDEDDDVSKEQIQIEPSPPPTKRRRTDHCYSAKERLYYHNQMKTQLEWATLRARQGNRNMRQFYLERAHEFALKAGILDDEFHSEYSSKVPETQHERDYHIRCLQQDLKLAQERARSGSKKLMEFRLAQAVKAAKKVGLYDTKLRSRVQSIRDSLQSEKEYHIHQMKNYLRLASHEAEDGNRSMMEFRLADAHQHAKAAGLDDRTFHRQCTSSRDSLTEIKEKTYWRSQIQVRIKRAEDYAKSGNRKLAYHAVGKAKEAAKNAGVNDSVTETLIPNIESYFQDTETVAW